MEPDDIVCNCMQISKSEIIEAILSENLTSVEEIGDAIEAGTVCGTCQDDLKDILNELNSD